MKNGIWLNENKFVSFAELEQHLRGEIATRQNSARFFGTLFTILPDPDDVINKMGDPVGTYNKMERDPHIYAEFEKRKALTTSLTLHIERNRASEKYAQLIEDYLLSNDNELFDSLVEDSDNEDANVHDLIESGLDCIAHGYQPVEVVWELVNGIRLPVKLIDRPRHWFHFDKNGKLRFKSKGSPMEGELLPEKKFLLFRHKPRYDNPYGVRVLSRCFWAWTFKHSTEKWKIQFLEKFATVWAIGKLPRGKDNKEYQNMLDSLFDMINNAVTVIPDDGSVELVEPAGKGSTSNIFDGNIKLYNEEMSKAILTVTSMTGADTKGSYASDQVRERMVMALASSDKKIPERKITQLIGWIFDVNGWGHSPSAELWEPEDYDKERADRDKILIEQGLRFKKIYYSEKYGFNEDEFDVKEPSSNNPVQPPVKTDPLEFAEPDQTSELKKLLNNLPSNTLQTMIEPMVNQIKKAFEESTSFEEAMEKAITLIPGINTDQLEELIAKFRFTSFIKGSIDAKDIQQ